MTDKEWHYIRLSVELIADESAQIQKVVLATLSTPVTVYRTNSCIRIDIHTTKE